MLNMILLLLSIPAAIALGFMDGDMRWLLLLGIPMYVTMIVSPANDRARLRNKGTDKELKVLSYMILGNFIISAVLMMLIYGAGYAVGWLFS